MTFTHRTVHAISVEPSQSYTRTFDGYKAVARIVPAGTPGVIEYEGIIGGHPVVMFRCRLGQWNLVNNPAPNVERIPEGEAA